MNYLAPGVYIEEIPASAHSIEAVGTSTAAFVGEAPDDGAFVKTAEPVKDWTDFRNKFSTATSKSTLLSHAIYGFFANGGGRCYVVNIGKGGSVEEGLRRLEAIDEVAIVAAPGFSDVGSYDALLTHCETLKDRFAILDAPLDVPRIDALKDVATVASKAKGKAKASDGESTDPAASSDGLRARTSDGGYGAYYFPWLIARDPFDMKSSEQVQVPPSGHLAGIYARTDATRGVHKAPANESVRGALGLTYRVTQKEQELLNPNGVNCIRFFTGEGIRVWGARTVAASSSEWRYVNVRRLMNMIEESIAKNTKWAVFQPHDTSLRMNIRRNIASFLTLLWRRGALVGGTPDEAFFVKCDDETNPPESVDAGQVVVVIGVAPVKPAEFVIFQIGQGVAGPEVTAQT